MDRDNAEARAVKAATADKRVVAVVRAEVEDSARAVVAAAVKAEVVARAAGRAVAEVDRVVVVGRADKRAAAAAEANLQSCGRSLLQRRSASFRRIS